MKKSSSCYLVTTHPFSVLCATHVKYAKNDIHYAFGLNFVDKECNFIQKILFLTIPNKSRKSSCIGTYNILDWNRMWYELAIKEIFRKKIIPKMEEENLYLYHARLFSLKEVKKIIGHDDNKLEVYELENHIKSYFDGGCFGEDWYKHINIESLKKTISMHEIAKKEKGKK